MNRNGPSTLIWPLEMMTTSTYPESSCTNSHIPLASGIAPVKRKGRHTVTPQEVEGVSCLGRKLRKSQRRRSLSSRTWGNDVTRQGGGHHRASNRHDCPGGGGESASNGQRRAPRERPAAESAIQAAESGQTGHSDADLRTGQTASIWAGDEIIFYIYGVSTTYRIRKWQKWSEVVHFARRERTTCRHGVDHH